MALDVKKLMETNSDLLERMRSEDWDISYDRKADMVFVHGETPKNSMYYHVGTDGFMVRMSDKYKIYGFAIEGYKNFAKSHTDVEWALMPITHPIVFRLSISLAKTIKKVDQLKEIAEYLSSTAAYRVGGAASIN